MDSSDDLLKSEEISQNLQGQHLLIDQISHIIQNPIDNQIYFKKKKLKNHSQLNTYIFPIQVLKLKTLKGRDQFKQMIRKQANQTQLDRGWRIYKHQLRSHEYSIYVRCLFCKANIYYREKKDQSWQLLKYTNNHKHALEGQKLSQPALQIEQPELIAEKNTQKNIVNKFIPSKKEIYPSPPSPSPPPPPPPKRNMKNNYKHTKFIHIKELLRVYNYELRYESYKIGSTKETFPQTLVAVSTQQKNNYRKFGESLSYDITYECLQERSINEQKYGVGIFSGFDSNKRIVIFGFSISTFQSISHYQNIFKWFFDIMELNRTSSIIANEDEKLIVALAQIRKKQTHRYHYIYDIENFMKQFIATLKGKKKLVITAISDYTLNLLQQGDPISGQKLLKQLKEIMQKQDLMNEFQMLQQRSQNLCLWKFPRLFVGLSQHSNSCINQILKIKEQAQIPLYDFIQKFDIESQQRTFKSENKVELQGYPFEIFFDDPRIKEIRYKIEKKVFNSFITNYHKAQFFRIKNSNEKHQYEIEHRIEKNLYLISNWQCFCGILEKTGIPCQHIIFLYNRQYSKESFVTLFHDRWVIPEEKKNIGGYLTKDGKRRRTRKNEII